MYIWAETLIAACFYYSGLVQLAIWLKRRARKSLIILCYHRATGGDLRQHFLYLRRHYRLLHLEEALAELYMPSKSSSKHKDRRTPLVLTFDDGYYDNYTHAFALARKLEVPITIFLIPGYIDSGSRFWWQEPEYLLCHAQVSKVTLEGRTYSLDALEERKALVQSIEARIRHAVSVSEREEFIASMHALLRIPTESSAITDAEKAALPITWTEAQEMEHSGWVSFGAHTMHHPVLAYLTDLTELQYEVQECKVILERQLGHAVRTFAYPIGYPEHFGKQGQYAVQASGYDWAVTAIAGFNTQQTNPYFLRRIVVDVDQHWLRVIVKASGVWAIFTHLCRLPIMFLRKFTKNKL
jgi:peptidoglycan/xylan/chitin deacetylase (PgdA/CDA1 family)